MDDATGSPQPDEITRQAGAYHLQSQTGFQLRVASQIAIEQFAQVYGSDIETTKITTSQFVVPPSCGRRQTCRKRIWRGAPQ